jgi:hypothetical protein
MARAPRKQTTKHDKAAEKPEFKSWNSFEDFARVVRFMRRYMFDGDVQHFLNTVLATSGRRRTTIREGTTLFRAQRGVQFQPPLDGLDDDDSPLMLTGWPAERMKPDQNHAEDGRVSPAGICVLYLASSKQTAISEIRPWVGSEISVGYLKIVRELKAIDLSVGNGKIAVGELTLSQLAGEHLVDQKTKEKAVWIDIDNAFSKPVTRESSVTDYVPTQILAELFRDAGYDAIIYRSQFGAGDAKGYNVALFNLDDAEVVACEPHRITRLAVTFEPCGNGWHRAGT